jgi:hypothetical protein
LRYAILVVWSALLILGGLSHALGVGLAWPAALVAGALAARDAHRIEAHRFQAATTFPLKFAGTFLAVLLALPVALPWYLRLRYQIVRGQLPERTKPRSLIPGILFLGLAAALLLWVRLRPPAMFRDLRPAYAAGPLTAFA